MTRKVIRKNSSGAGDDNDDVDDAERRQKLYEEKFDNPEKIYQNVSTIADAFANKMTNADVEVLDLNGNVCNRVNFVKADRLLQSGVAIVVEYYPTKDNENGDDDDDENNENIQATTTSTSPSNKRTFTKPKNMIKKPKRIQQLKSTPNNKTVLCGMFAQGKCTLSETCSYAHGFDDLSPDVQEKVKMVQKNLNDSRGVSRGGGVGGDRGAQNCELCLTPDRNMCSSTVVPAAFLVLMGPDVARESGCGVQLFYCTKCKKLVDGMNDLSKTLEIQARTYFNNISIRNKTIT